MEQDYSRDTLDILGKMPSRYVRYGLSVFFLILITIFTGICFIHYPDTFKTTVKIYESKSFSDTIINSTDKYIAYIQINSSDIWKIKENSSVIIFLNQYPKNVYGTLSGNITKVTNSNDGQVYEIYIRLSNGLTTNFNKHLEFLSDMSGIAIIKGKEKSIFKRIFPSILLKNS